MKDEPQFRDIAKDFGGQMKELGMKQAKLEMLALISSGDDESILNKIRNYLREE